MSIGYRIRTNFTRPSSDLIQAFSEIPVPNIGDSMNRMASVNSSLQALNQTRLIGPAYTVKAPAGDNLLFYYAIANALPGDIIVVDGGGYTERALCGEIMVTWAMKRKLGGFVVDAAIRDKVELEKLPFPVFAKSSNPNGPYKNGPGEINTPVNIGGVVVSPGDIIVGDRDGLVVIPQKDAPKILLQAQAVQRKEKQMMDDILTKGNPDISWLFEKLEKSSCEFIDEVTSHD